MAHHPYQPLHAHVLLPKSHLLLTFKPFTHAYAKAKLVVCENVFNWTLL